MRRRLSLLACLATAMLHPLLGFGREELKETVIVTAHASPVTFENLGRAVSIITRDQIDLLPVQSVADLLRYVSGIDVRSRSPFGVQSDFKARGAGFGQTLILLDGLRMNDSQTGHHNADLPIALSDVERVEILHGAGSSVHGADAFGVTINIVTRDDRRLVGRLSGGMHGLVEGEGRVGFATGAVDQQISLFGNRSSGFMFDRDFQTVGLTSRTAFDSGSVIRFSHLNKEFGAAGFYGPSPSKEWTDSTMLSFATPIRISGNRRLRTRAFYRTHGDHFLWDIARPGFFENRHRTHAVGASLEGEAFLREDSKVTWGGELGRDWITSNNLGRHAYQRGALFAELQQKLGDRITLVPGVRFDRYSGFGSSFSPSVSLSWWVDPRLKIRSSAGHAFRIPTFTELYYRDPNHRASSALQPEEAWETEVGVDWIAPNDWLIQASTFVRWDRDVIDWVRATTAEQWRTANIRTLGVKGLELGVQKSLPQSLGAFRAQYTHLRLDSGASPLLSKYVEDFADHSFSVFGTLRLPGQVQLAQDAHLRFLSRGERYWILNQKWLRRWGKVALFIEVANLLNRRYEEIRGVPMPGRWVRAGLEVAIPSGSDLSSVDP